MKLLASKVTTKSSNVENWFKHKRRLDVKMGLMKFEVCR